MLTMVLYLLFGKWTAELMLFFMDKVLQVDIVSKKLCVDFSLWT